jgi:predicted MFS family arabinose efflux permease
MIATRLARRVGLLNTMVFTHLPSNIMLMALPFAPTLTAAWLIFLIRFPLSQMDVPTRQGYLAALTPPEERAPAAAVTNASRTAARPLGAFVGGLVTGPATAVTGLPFLIAGGLKSVYDLWLFFWFRKVPIDDPARHPRRRDSA